MKIEGKELKVLFSEEQIQTRIKELGQELNDIYKGEEVIAICVLKGALFFAIDLSKHLNMPLQMEFIKLSSYGNGKASSGKVNAVDISLPDLNDKNVIILEDIIDTGLTAKFLIDFINNNFKTKSTRFCSLLDKKCSRVTDIQPDLYGFDIDDKFLIGYGLDYEDIYRNLTYIGHLE